MNTNRRTLIAGLAAAPALLLPARFAHAADPLKISVRVVLTPKGISGIDFAPNLPRKLIVAAAAR